MSELLLNTWHCNEPSCSGIFYTDLEGEMPAFCPYCGVDDLEDSKVLKADPIL